MSSDRSRRTDGSEVRLSGKEVSGLAGRVLSSAFLPPGAVGGAAEAVEFMELCGANGLALLDGEKDNLTAAAWQAPEVEFEGAGLASCNAHGVSALFFAAPLADWLGGMARANGAAAIGIAGAEHQHYLATVQYRLARAGQSSLLIHTAQGSGLAVSAAIAGAGRWNYARAPALPPRLRALAGWLAAPSQDAATLDAVRTLASAWLRGAPTETVETATAIAAPAPMAVLFALGPDAPQNVSADWLEAEFSTIPNTLQIDGEAFEALRRRVRAEGWPMPRARWERLMAFADRSLIRTSERSRAGAG